MIIAQIIKSRVPPVGYGGTERVVDWLSRALIRLGHRVVLVAPPGSRLAGGELVEIPPGANSPDEIMALVPPEAELLHFCFPPGKEPSRPGLVTIHGNMGFDEVPGRNTVFLSRDHARRHGSRHFVYNGLDPDDYEFRREKDDYFLFLSKFLFRKGLDAALGLARDLDLNLVAAGGRRPSWRKKTRFVGDVGGEEKRRLLAGARALIFPIRWPEPFGLVVIEALASGTPVIAARVGSLPEIITPETGFLCDTYDDFVRAIGRVGEIDPEACRKRVEELFTSECMARNYLRYYGQILEKGGVGEKSLAEE
ncbi:MAG: glycosyltransferase family 4 protein [bacterium]|nr:glycosyltransferase family 4 protein [bacterium]